MRSVSCPIIDGNLPIFVDFSWEIKISTICDVIKKMQECKFSTEGLIFFLVTVLAMIHFDIGQ